MFFCSLACCRGLSVSRIIFCSCPLQRAFTIEKNIFQVRPLQRALIIVNTLLQSRPLQRAFTIENNVLQYCPLQGAFIVNDILLQSCPIHRNFTIENELSSITMPFLLLKLEIGLVLQVQDYVKRERTISQGSPTFGFKGQYKSVSHSQPVVSLSTKASDFTNVVDSETGVNIFASL